ncbi:hypothetical protein [Brassicibacter mesophilus]|uniref:hypothetical protein n=1 Tax=Brassicibacter mesophilus TaxID=745119 RepID=UPI003D2412BE
MRKKDEQFSNLMKYCLNGKRENFKNIEKFLCMLRETSSMFGYKELVEMSRELYLCLILYGDSAKKDKDLLLKILSLYSGIYAEIKELNKDIAYADAIAK